MRKSRFVWSALFAATAVAAVLQAPATATAAATPVRAAAQACPDALVVRDDAVGWERVEGLDGHKFVMTPTLGSLPKGTCIVGTDQAVEGDFSEYNASTGYLRPYARGDKNYGYRDFYRITQLTYPDKPDTRITPTKPTWVSGCALFNTRCTPVGR